MTQKVPCTECGALILPLTYENNGDLCMPCKRGNREQLEAAKAAYEKAKEPDPFWHAWRTIGTKINAHGFSSLKKEEKEFYVMNSLVGSVERGVFHVYFDTHPKEEIEEAKLAFRRHQHDEISDLISAAEKILFPNGIPSDFLMQQELMPCWTEEEIENDVDPEWSQKIEHANGEFYEISESAYPTIENYFQKHLYEDYKS